MIRVLLADDQALVPGGFQMILSSQADIDVVGEAADGRQAVELARHLSPTSCSWTSECPNRTDSRRRAGTASVTPYPPRVLILTTWDRDEYVYEALKAGASGFLLKDVRPEQLVEAVRTVAAGDALLAPTITRRLIENFVRRPPPGGKARPSDLDSLTSRETEVLRHIAGGLSNLKIADTLFVTEATVKTHVNRILAKLGLATERRRSSTHTRPDSSSGPKLNRRTVGLPPISACSPRPPRSTPACAHGHRRRQRRSAAGRFALRSHSS